MREAKTLVGAESLRHSVPEVSRRHAAAVKAETETAIERERKAATTRVVVTVPGVARGFDGMHVGTEEGRRELLVASDACVPYRTTLELAERYDGPTLAALFELDFERHGAPLVLREDRWKAHETKEVMEVLGRHGVLLLHGPAHYPQFYGQTERQNREHRVLLRELGAAAVEVIEREMRRFVTALNTMWRRCTLAWKSAEEVRMGRAEIAAALRARFIGSVQETTERIGRDLLGRGEGTDQAHRFAIEAVLT